jgi:hypothetical protein
MDICANRTQQVATVRLSTPTRALMAVLVAAVVSPGCHHPPQGAPANVTAPAPPLTGAWPFTLGPAGASFVAGTMTESGDIVVTGASSSGALPPYGAGVTFSGWADAVLVALDSCGRCLWMRTAGTPFDDIVDLGRSGAAFVLSLTGDRH